MAEQWQYLARNLKKIIGPGMENDFNKLGAEGWEFVAVAKDCGLQAQGGRLGN
jgi:hypothetical protein